MERRIGIVEDESLIALDISYMVEKLGYKTAFISDSAASVYKCLKENLPDLILMDVELKGEISGIDMARNVINEHNIPVVFLTAHEDEKTTEKMAKVSKFGYLTKPFGDQELRAVLEKFFG